MTDSMIERAARAMLADLDRQDGGDGNSDYGMNADGRVDYIDQTSVNVFDIARAVLTAMREPTEAMMGTKRHVDQGKIVPGMPKWSSYVWPAMIDAALGDGR